MSKKITFIGSGNVATFLATSFYKKGCIINQVYSLSTTNAGVLANKVNAKVCTEIEQLDTEVDFVIIAINDTKIAEIANKLNNCSAIILHCAGSQPIDVLSFNAPNYGVIYPLQTFSKNTHPTHLNFPFFIEGGNTETTNEIKKLVQIISDNIHEANSEQRQTVHLAAVFTNNFVNHILGVSKAILEKDNLSLDYLQPLLLETITKSQNTNPFIIQTGPAARNDVSTVTKHNELLKKYNPNFAVIYNAITKSIQENK